MKRFFDITTSALWTGPPVGILRVERNLAKHALDRQPETGFSVWSQRHRSFFEVDRAIAAEIIAGEKRLSLQWPPPRLNRTLKGILRSLLIRSDYAYLLAHRVRGRHVTRAQIPELRRLVTGPPQPKLIPRWQHHAKPIALGADVEIISAGLDWDHKDLSAIRALKSLHGFNYTAVVYDLIPLLFPHYAAPAGVEHYRTYFKTLMHVADVAMCISHCTKHDLLTYYDTHGANPPHTRVFPLGCDLAAPADETAIPQALAGKSYALFVSTIEPRKNHRTVYEAFDRLLREGSLSPDRHRLVFVGREGWAVSELLAEIRANPVTRNTVLILDRVPDNTLALLIRQSAFMLFPSHYEGYGLPLAESLAMGKAVLTSDTAALIEVGADAPWRLAAKDVLAWVNAMRTLFCDPSKVDALEQRAARRVPILWSAAASIFFEQLDGITENPGSRANTFTN